MHVCTHNVYVYMYIYIYTYIYVCICIYSYMHMYTYMCARDEGDENGFPVGGRKGIRPIDPTLL